MAIKKIKVSNFKSFKNLDVELGSFNVLIGANASGKSNFIQIFRFLHDIEDSGLDNAISMQGGIEYLRNINIGPSDNTTFEVTSDTGSGWGVGKGLGFRTFQSNYKFSLQSNKKSITVVHDELARIGKIFQLEETNRKIHEKEELGQGVLTLSNIKGALSFKVAIKPKTIPVKKDDIFPKPLLSLLNIKFENTLLLERHFFFPPFFISVPDIAIYDFDPKLPKKAVPVTGKIDLEENGENLALVLKNIISDKNKERKFSNLIRDLLPFVKGVDVERFADKSLLFNLREKYFDKQTLPAFLLSDGTVNLAAMILALYFEEAPVTIIEEPERNIHPHLISKVVEMMKDASKNKQIIVTTHNPEVVKHAGLDNILLVSRDENGFSTISKPADKKEVKIFLKNELGIDELYVQNLLEV
ncbi:MAG: AAA family ATPase [Sedimentisphaerales bacterium]|nr:AAA family ATPase [Sedimentisphaerales bacterium]